MSAPQPPTVKALVASVRANFESKFSTEIPLLERSLIWVLSLIVGAGLALVYKYAAWWAQQPFARYAGWDYVTVGTKRIRPLVEIGRVAGAGDPKGATRAQLVVKAVVQQATGSVAKNTPLTCEDNGFTYLLNEDVDVSSATVGATVELTVTASSDDNGGGGYGSAGNLHAGAVVEFANSVPQFARETTVASHAVTAADPETESAYRGRVMRRRARPLQGGAYADYEHWCESVPGILRCHPQTGRPGEMLVYIEATTSSTGSVDGIPTSAQLAACETACFQDESGKAKRAPGGTPTTAIAIERQALDVEITGLAVDAEAECKAAVKAALDEYFRSLEVYVVGLSVPPRRDRALSMDVGGIISDIVRSYGGTISSHKLKYGGDEISSFAATPQRKLRLGDDLWN